MTRYAPRDLTRSILFLSVWILGCAASDPASAQSLYEDFQSHPLNEQWVDGGTYEKWFDQFNGYGSQTIVLDSVDGVPVLQQTPQRSTAESETHASLATSLMVFKDLTVEAKVKTVQQLRSSPNAWERDWLIWHYLDNNHFYYVSCKTSGWEVGKRDPAYPGSQRFLKTGSSVTCPVGTWHNYQVTQKRATMTVIIDGIQVYQFTDKQRPYLSGSVGLYTEDAQVNWSIINAESEDPILSL